jgi:hypothetical protein
VQAIPFKAGVAVLLTAATGGFAEAQNNGIEFGEAKTRYEIQRNLDAKTTVSPWQVDCCYAVAWQHGNARPRPYFALYQSLCHDT